VPRRLTLPGSAFQDVQSLLRLDEEKLRTLADLLGTSASTTPHTPDFIRKATERLHLDTPTVESIVLAYQFLRTVVEEGNPPRDILNDVRELVAQHAPADGEGIVSALDRNRNFLESLLTPKPAKAQEQTVDPRGGAAAEVPRSRNIAVAYEEVVLTEEDAEILRRMREAPTPPAGRPTRPPRRMQDG
jgi:hypothetical protein